MTDGSSRRIKPLPPSATQHSAEFRRRWWYISIPSGYSASDIENPALWQHATQFQENDIVECLAEDGSFDGWWRVLSVGAGFAVLRPIFVWQHGGARPVVDAGAGSLARVEYLPVGGWTTFDHSGERIGSHGSEAEADGALAEYLSANEMEAA